jgi:ATP-dependent DNA helicase RecG
MPESSRLTFSGTLLHSQTPMAAIYTVGVRDPSITNKNRIVGFAKPEDANNHINMLLTQTQPSVDGTDVRFIDFGGDGLVLQVSVPKSPQVHYTADQRCFVRVNASTREVKGDKVTQLAYAKGSYSYERVTIAHLTIDDIADSPVLSDYLKRIGSALGSRQFLRKNRLVADHKGKPRPTAGAVLLFDEEPQATLDTRCAIKVYRLQTTDAEYKREHLKETPTTIEGPLEHQINQVIQRVSDLLKDVAVSVGGKLRKAYYPSAALKELLVNAVIHRDYSLNDDIHVRIYDNRVEIQSPGRLPGYITKGKHSR